MSNFRAINTIMVNPHGEWVPCSQEMPKPGERVLVWAEVDERTGTKFIKATKTEKAVGFLMKTLIPGKYEWWIVPSGYRYPNWNIIAWRPLPDD